MVLIDFTTEDCEYFTCDNNVNEINYGTSGDFRSGVNNTEILI